MAITLLQFRQYADKCRRLAYSGRPEEERAALREMAEAWEALAQERQRVLFGKSDVAHAGTPQRA